MYIDIFAFFLEAPRKKCSSKRLSSKPFKDFISSTCSLGEEETVWTPIPKSKQTKKSTLYLLTVNCFLKGSRVQLVIPLDSYVLDKVVPLAPSSLVNDWAFHTRSQCHHFVLIQTCLPVECSKQVCLEHPTTSLLVWNNTINNKHTLIKNI